MWNRCRSIGHSSPGICGKWTDDVRLRSGGRTACCIAECPGLSGSGGGSTIGSAAAFANDAVFVTVAGGAWSFEEP